MEAALIQKLQQKLQELRQNIASVYMGNALAIDRVIITLLSRGHILIEDVPGVGKTVLASAVAKSIKGSFARIQCTPDLLPSDITGVNILDRTSADFTFRQGPIFNNIVVADEINRTTPRTQSALLEAMGENSVLLMEKHARYLRHLWLSQRKILMSLRALMFFQKTSLTVF